MTTWIALLRGVNVGGKGLLPMAELTTILEGLGCSAVQTYVQSGNAIFGHAKATASQLAERIGGAIEKRRGFRPKVLVLRVEELAKAVAANPFRDAEGVPTSIHLFFLAAKPAGDRMRALDAIKSPTESIVLKGNVLYVHAPDGFGNSKLAQRAERILGVDATARNWRTVTTVLAKAG